MTWDIFRFQAKWPKLFSLFDLYVSTFFTLPFKGLESFTRRFVKWVAKGMGNIETLMRSVMIIIWNGIFSFIDSNFCRNYSTTVFNITAQGFSNHQIWLDNDCFLKLLPFTVNFRLQLHSFAQEWRKRTKTCLPTRTLTHAANTSLMWDNGLTARPMWIFWNRFWFRYEGAQGSVSQYPKFKGAPPDMTVKQGHSNLTIVISGPTSTFV